MPTPEELQRQQDSLLALLSNGSQSGQYGRTSDLLAQDTDQFGRYDPRGGQAYTAGVEESLEDDPWTQHYADMGEAQSQETLYNRPGQQQQREDALMRVLAPIRERGGYTLEQQRIASEGTLGAAQATANGRQATQDASMARTQASQAGQAQRQRNALLESRAKTAQTSGRSALNPMTWLFGKPTGEEEAANIRSQQQFGTQRPLQPTGDIVEQIKAAIAAQGYDPETADIEGLMNDPEAMAELGF